LSNRRQDFFNQTSGRNSSDRNSSDRMPQGDSRESSNAISGNPQIRKSVGQVVDFNESLNKAKQKTQPISDEAKAHNSRQEHLQAQSSLARQEAQRLLACRREAFANILVTSLFTIVAAFALANFLPQFLGQKQKLQQISTDVKDLEKKVEILREQFSITFDSGKSKEFNFRRNGWFKPSQVPIKPEVNPRTEN
jgi:outer membrane murein-binding lipoprotein Lpp